MDSVLIFQQITLEEPKESFRAVILFGVARKLAVNTRSTSVPSLNRAVTVLETELRTESCWNIRQ